MNFNTFFLATTGEKSTDEQNLTMIVTLGFFWFEFGWYLTYPHTKTWIMWFHHVATMSALSSVIYSGDSGSECCVVIFLSEVTIPPLLLRWFMRDAGYRPIFVLAVEYIFLAGYFVIRAIVLTIAVKDCVLHPKPYVLSKISLTLLWVSGLIFFWTTARGTVRRTVSMWNGYGQLQAKEKAVRCEFNAKAGSKGC